MVEGIGFTVSKFVKQFCIFLIEHDYSPNFEEVQEEYCFWLVLTLLHSEGQNSMEVGLFWVQ